MRRAQLFDGEQNAAKLDYVLAELTRRFPKLDAQLLRALVEAAVYRLKQARGF